MYWTVHLTGGPQRVNHAAVIVGDKVYSFGGYCSGENYHLRRPIDVHILNTVTLRWKVFIPSAPSKQHVPYIRYGHTAVVYGTKVYVWGGRNDTSACNKLYCFDTECLTWSLVKTEGKVKPGARDGHSACVIGDYMYIFGGFEDDVERFSQDVYKLCFRTFTWSFVYTTGEPPSYRDFHSATAIDNRMFVFGGRGDESAPHHSRLELYCNNIMYLDVVENRWHTPVTTGDTPVGRRSHSAFVYKDQIYIFGGFNGLKGMHFNDLHRFDPYTMTWQNLHPLGEPPSKRRRQSCVVYRNRMFLFGGTSPERENDVTNNHQLNPVVVLGQPLADRPNDENLESKLNDHDDLHVLEFEPSLRTLGLMAVKNYQLDISYLPEVLKWEFDAMTNNKTIQRLTSNQG